MLHSLTFVCVVECLRRRTLQMWSFLCYAFVGSIQLLGVFSAAGRMGQWTDTLNFAFLVLVVRVAFNSVAAWAFYSMRLLAPEVRHSLICSWLHPTFLCSFFRFSFPSFTSDQMLLVGYTRKHPRIESARTQRARAAAARSAHRCGRRRRVGAGRGAARFTASGAGRPARR